MIEADHAISTRESYLGLQDALRKVRAANGSQWLGAWAGANVCIEEGIGVVVLISQEKWDWMKTICAHWLKELEVNSPMLDYKRLQSDRGFMVYVTQAYPGLKPYLKGFHLSLEMWCGGRDEEGWKVKQPQEEEDKDLTNLEPSPGHMEEVKISLFVESVSGNSTRKQGPSDGLTPPSACFKEDLEAILFLTDSKEPATRCVCNI